MESFVSTKQVAEFLGLAPRTIVRMAREGRIPAHPVTGTARRTWRFRLGEVALFFAPQPATPIFEPERPSPAEKGKR
jgi:excisionase family DNA binding protein